MLKSNKVKTGLVMLIVLLTIAVSAPLLAPNDPYETHIDHRLEDPSLHFFMGTDYLGRCEFSRIIYGTRLSLKIALIIVGVQMISGIFLGALAGYSGGFVDGFIMRLTDMCMALPALVLALVLATITGPGLGGITAALCLTGWTEYARVIRGDVLAIKEKEFVKSARAFGFSNTYILLRHVIPNVCAPVIVLATLSTGFVILIVSALSFIGLGAQPPVADWGSMLSEARAYMRTSPHLTLFPGLAIMGTTLAFYLLGEGFRDTMDPRFKFKLKEAIK